MYHPQPDWSEQDPEEVFKAVIESSNKIIQSLPSLTPALVAFSSAMHSLIAVDKNNKPLTNSIIWADNRAGEIAVGLRNTEWGREIYNNTGVPVHAMSPLCKLIWLKENQPELFRKADKFIGIKEYIFYKIFHQHIVDTSIASATGLLNIRTLKWHEKILNFLEISPSYLSDVVPVKFQLKFQRNEIAQEAREWLIPEGTPFIIGGSDGALANLGTGAVDQHSMAISIGTSGAARIIVEEVEIDAKMRTFCYHVKDKQYIIGGPSNNGGVVLEWLKQNILESKESHEEVFQQAESIKPGSDGLIFIPYVLGERAPVWNSKAKGIFFGLSIDHTKAHMLRACMEGIVYSMYSIARILLAKRTITEIHATGGFTHSPLWLQMLADMCNTKLLVSGAVESSALGAVIAGMEALNIEPFPRKPILSSYEPNLLNHEVYRKGFEKFERIYDVLKDELTNETSPSLQAQLK
jgi:gluconokinase